MKNILLLTDFTAKSENAHQYAFKYFKGQECTFHLLSIQKAWDFTMDDLMVASSKSSVDNALLEDNRSDLASLIIKYTSIYSNGTYTFKSHVDYDIFTDAISQAVLKYKIDIVVCGTDGNTGVMEAIFSSHTLRVIHTSDCSVLVVPEHYTYEVPKRVQYLLDYDDSFDTCGKDLFDELILNYKPKVSVLRLTFALEMHPVECDAEEVEIKSLYPHVPLDYHILSTEQPINEIDEFAEKNDVQMQVISVKKQTFLERVFSNSHLSDIVNSSSLPVFILRECEK